MNSFINSGQAYQYFSEANDYDSATFQAALTNSFGLTLAYLSPAVKTPLTAVWDGDSYEVPSILKVCQGQFLSYLLQMSNVGYREDLALQYAQTAEILRGITAGEIGIDGVASASTAGWRTTSATTNSGMLNIDPTSPAPAYPTTINVEILTAGYPLTATFEYSYPQLASTAHQTALQTPVPSSPLTIGNEGLTISFEGYLAAGDTWIIVGTSPSASPMPESTNTIIQRRISL